MIKNAIPVLVKLAFLLAEHSTELAYEERSHLLAQVKQVCTQIQRNKAAAKGKSRLFANSEEETAVPAKPPLPRIAPQPMDLSHLNTTSVGDPGVKRTAADMEGVSPDDRVDDLQKRVRYLSVSPSAPSDATLRGTPQVPSQFPQVFDKYAKQYATKKEEQWARKKETFEKKIEELKARLTKKETEMEEAQTEYYKWKDEYKMHIAGFHQFFGAEL